MLIRYESNVETDLLLTKWWMLLAETRDLEQVFTADYAVLSRFLFGFQPPTTLLYATDAEGIWFAAWVDPIMSGAFFGFWVREAYRPSVSSNMEPTLAVTHEAFTTFFREYPILFQISRSHHIMELAERLGGHVMGSVPYIFDGESAFVAYLTREGFKSYMESLNV